MVAQCFLLYPFVFFLELDFGVPCEGHVRCSCLVPQLQGAVIRGMCFLLLVCGTINGTPESWMLTGPASSYLCMVTDFFPVALNCVSWTSEFTAI